VPQTVVVTFKVPVELVEKLDELVRIGIFKNRSEALRHALVMLLSKYGGILAGGEAVSGGYGASIQTSKAYRDF
jgi:Arc/MetJ-type ribon-helix-helix transcriptional regulator